MNYTADAADCNDDRRTYRSHAHGIVAGDRLEAEHRFPESSGGCFRQVDQAFVHRTGPSSIDRKDIEGNPSARRRNSNRNSKLVFRRREQVGR